MISNQKLWIYFNFLASTCSVAGICALLLQESEYLVEITVGFVFFSVATVLVGWALRRRYRMQIATRKAIINTGVSLMRGTKDKVVMFAGDMTWIDDYASTIRSITDQGKVVKVLHKNSDAFTVQRNADHLRELGAVCEAVRYESTLRGMFIDPNDFENGMLFVTDRRLRSGGQTVEVGEKSKDENYIYMAKIYNSIEDPKVLDSIRDKIHMIGSES